MLSEEADIRLKITLAQLLATIPLVSIEIVFLFPNFSHWPWHQISGLWAECPVSTAEELQGWLSPGSTYCLGSQSATSLWEHSTAPSSLKQKGTHFIIETHAPPPCPFSPWEPFVQCTERIGVKGWIRLLATDHPEFEMNYAFFFIFPPATSLYHTAPTTWTYTNINLSIVLRYSDQEEKVTVIMHP